MIVLIVHHCVYSSIHVRVRACAFSGCSPSERLISRVGGQARSKTPNADMERSAYGADCTRNPAYLSKVTHVQIVLTCTQVMALRSSP